MRFRVLPLLLLGVAGAGAPAHAALWSVPNEVARRGYNFTAVASLTGDGVAVAAEVDVLIPTDVSVLSTTGRNGGACNYIASLGVVRIVWDDPALRPLPAVDTPMCDLRLRVASGSSAPWHWLNLKLPRCYRADASMYGCASDRGYLTITP
jgi:hypothetical protein